MKGQVWSFLGVSQKVTVLKCNDLKRNIVCICLQLRTKNAVYIYIYIYISQDAVYGTWLEGNDRI